MKNLPPEERIKRLKKLEEEKKKEIASAREEIKKSQDELTERRKWAEKVPIPEFAKESLEGLSEEEKKILRQKGLKERRDIDGDNLEEIVPQKERDLALEETVAREAVGLPPEAMGVEYAPVRSEKPMDDLYRDALALRDSIEEKGYASREDERRAQYLLGVAEERVEGGTYSFTEDTAKAASLIQRIGADVRSVYKSSSSGNPHYQR